jgi:hypothetical protein
MDFAKLTTYFGAAATIIVGALLLCLHVFAAPRVPVLARWDLPPLVYLAPDAPVTVEEVVEVLDELQHLGHGIPTVTAELPRSYDDGIPFKGAIVITLRDQGLTDEHGGQTRLEVREGRIHHAVVLLPNGLEGERRRLILGHEVVGHAALGLGHVQTQVAGPFISIPTGHLMHPVTSGLGWDTDGIPIAPGL